MVFGVLDGLEAAHGPRLVILQGGCPTGADALARKWCCLKGVPYENFPADWRKYGRKAGPIRNTRMIEEGAPDLCVSLPGGSGTADCTRKARAAGIRIMQVVEPEREHSNQSDASDHYK
jgi:hypothetical protein